MQIAGFLISFISGSVPMLLYAGLLYWLDRYEREPLKMLLGTFLWGSIIAAAGSLFINTITGLGLQLVTRSEYIADVSVSAFVAPVTEESLKGLAVFLVFAIFSSEFNSVMDGIIYAGITALGFAATENTYYIFLLGFQQNGWQGLFHVFVLRSLLLGWSHPFFTSFTGIGLAIHRTTTNRKKRVLSPIIGLTLAVIAHANHNLLASLFPGETGIVLALFWDWMGWMGLMAVILWATYQEKQAVQDALKGEVDKGVIPCSQYHIASSAWKQLFFRMRSLFRQQYSETNRFFQVCGELAHKKQDLANPAGNRDIEEEILALREELSSLSEVIHLT